MRVNHKTQIDAAVAEIIGCSPRHVRRITSEFLNQLALLLVAQGYVTLIEFGRFRVRAHKAGAEARLTKGKVQGGKPKPLVPVYVDHRLVVHFSQAHKLKRLMKGHVEDPMEKYGVDESVDQEQLEKRATKGCPECGAAPVRHGRVLLCPTHGSEPFEDDGPPDKR